MDLEFSQAARRLDRERAARLRDQERRRARERKAAAAAQDAHARVLARAEERRRAREQQQAAEAAALERTRGVSYESTLTAVPLAKADTNRITLPPSALQHLEAQRALDVLGGPLTFEVSITVPGVGAVRTHCGVDAFTADEGSVGIPPAAALSLARPEAGVPVDALAGRAVSVRFVQLPRFDEVSVALQPRGHGFHAGDADVVNIDLESVLQRTLRDVLTLTEGDVVPVRHAQNTYELVVRSVRPEPAVLVLNTDVAVDILPSERAEQQAARRQRRSDWLAARRARIDALARAEPEAAGPSSTGAMPRSDKGQAGAGAGPRPLQLRLRTPDGKTHTGSFAASDALGRVLDWALVRLPEAPEQLPMRRDDRAGFDLVRALGTRRDRFGADAQHVTLGDSGLADRDALVVSWNLVDDDDEANDADGEQGQEAEERVGGASDGQTRERDVEDADGPGSAAAPAAASDELGEERERVTFSAAQRSAEADLDRTLQDEQLRKAMQESARAHEQETGAEPVDKVRVFNDLVRGGMAPAEAANAAQHFAAQLLELQGMGFEAGAHSVELLRRYQGRLERVVNVLAGGD